MTAFHIAQLNIARAKADMESEAMSGFVARLDEINSLADEAPGFIWRLQGEEGDANALRVFQDPQLIVNLTVWESLEALRDFVYKTAHVELIRDREAWFKKLGESHMALWWVPQGTLPTVEEAKERLECVRENGPTAQAFTFGKSFPVEQGG